MFGYVTFLALQAVSCFWVGLWDFYLSQLLFLAAVPGVFLLLSQVMMRYTTNQVEKLGEYSHSMSEGGSSVDFSSLYRLRGVLVLWIVLVIAIQPLYVLGAPESFSLVQKLFTEYFPWLYFELFIASFTWVWGYSMISIYRMGKLSLKLKSFVEDRTLGLRPFGVTSARLTAFVLIVFAYLSFPQALVGLATLPLLIMFVSFFALGIIFFLLPLRILHTKLIAAKSDELKWLVPRYKSILQHIREANAGSIDSVLVTELNAIDKIQRDVHQIHDWPFDTGVVVRFTAILLSVIAIILSRILSIALHL